jgi:hypothetical protein
VICRGAHQMSGLFYSSWDAVIRDNAAFAFEPRNLLGLDIVEL